MAYLDLSGFTLLSLAPSTLITSCEITYPGWILAQLGLYSARIDVQLRKRYACPFATPVPDQVKAWLASLVTIRVFLKMGVEPTDQQFGEIAKDAQAALDEIREAAKPDGPNTFDLPLRQDTVATGIVAPATLAYSEAHPWTWTDVQRDASG